MHFISKSLGVFLLLLALTGIAVAQSQAPAADQSANQEKSKQDKAKPKAPELTADQQELDKLLLGAWSLLTDNTSAEMTDELFINALKKCETFPGVTQLDAEPGLEKQLPDEKELRGELIYFRTDQGLQRYQAKPSRVVLLPDVQKAVNAGGRTVWQVSGQYGQFALAFSDGLSVANTVLMLEQDRLYLKCGTPLQ